MKKSYFLSLSGWLEIAATDKGICAVNFMDDTPYAAAATDMDDIIAECISQLQEYFSGNRKVFDLPLDPEGTDFQKRVWAELVKIPFGRTVSYLDIAKALGDPKKIRAVGLANGRNPIAIIVPCHRVIGSDGTLVGYAGGLHRKRWLLQHEGAIPRELF